MLMDRFNTFIRGIKGILNLPAAAQALATTAAIVGSVINLGQSVTYFGGIAQYVRIRVMTAIVSAGTALGLSLCGSNDWNATTMTGTWTKVQDLVATTNAAAFNAALPIDTNVCFSLPASIPFQYISLQFGSTANGCTAGTITADITPVRE